jgi:chromosome partitioning protein
VRISIINLKGGVGKSTSAVFLAHGLARDGRTLLVDADPQGSALSWSVNAGGFPFSVVSLAVRDLHKRLPELAEDYKHVLIDTPPIDLGIMRSAALTVDTALIPLAPTGMDVERLKGTLDVLAEIESINPVEVRVLLTRVRSGTNSAKVLPGILGETLKLPLLGPSIPLGERYANAFGQPVTDIYEYADVLAALTERIRG